MIISIGEYFEKFQLFSCLIWLRTSCPSPSKWFSELRSRQTNKSHSRQKNLFYSFNQIKSIAISIFVQRNQVASTCYMVVQCIIQVDQSAIFFSNGTYNKVSLKTRIRMRREFKISDSFIILNDKEIIQSELTHTVKCKHTPMRIQNRIGVRVRKKKEMQSIL